MTANNDKGAAGPKNGRAMNGIDGDEVLAKIRRVYNILGELVQNECAERSFDSDKVKIYKEGKGNAYRTARSYLANLMDKISDMEGF